ncbi:hypothetical protein [Paenibacillus lactis]|uniref:Uncharacterized protein n=1 Tax=Paenibacillus lactis TaxID=228574 RepID=A0ABS4FLC0_9BACL|nr:hypothetical protein [Paenibacillus lactis]MBP1897070.1 hypothetical protein [Paenibacillus lactis]HAS7789731.1 hypothetical protein [Vibrio cholerae]
MIQYQQFFTVARMDEFLHNVKVLLYMVMPLLIIWIATQLGGYLIQVIRDAFDRTRRDREDDYDDDDYRRD